MGLSVALPDEVGALPLEHERHGLIEQLLQSAGGISMLASPVASLDYLILVNGGEKAREKVN